MSHLLVGSWVVTWLKKKEAFLVLLPDSVEIFGLVSHTCKALGGHTCATGVFICGVCFTRRTARFGQSLP